VLSTGDSTGLVKNREFCHRNRKIPLEAAVERRSSAPGRISTRTSARAAANANFSQPRRHNNQTFADDPPQPPFTLPYDGHGDRDAAVSDKSEIGWRFKPEKRAALEGILWRILWLASVIGHRS
jgi:hypothetical protein